MTSANEERTVTLRVRRSESRRIDSFEVKVAGPHIRVLDALLIVRRQQDPNLIFRFACRVGMCGSCAMVINGRERLACQTAVGDLDSSTINVAPLRSLPVQKDLMVDMAPFFNAMKRANAALTPSEPYLRAVRTIVPDTPNREAIESQSGCITCGACYSACEWTRTHPGYIGPAAMNRVMMLSLDEKDRLNEQRVETMATDNATLRCHAMGNCSAVCPVGIPLRKGMQRLRGFVATGRAKV
jgi:succinate dehydrogenase/fumarate reductase iron-sulfur protein